MNRGSGSSCTVGASISIWPGQRWSLRLVVVQDVAQVRSDPPAPQSHWRRLNRVSSGLCADGSGRTYSQKSERNDLVWVDRSARAAAGEARTRFLAGCAPGARDDEGRLNVHFGINSNRAPSGTGTMNPHRAAVSAFSAGHEQ
jgi:hypothetical protein